MNGEPRSPTIAPQALLEQAAFVRRLAFAILRNDADADDTAQDALARGLTNGPSDPGALRSWFAAVVRNLAHGLRRREARLGARERRASHREGSASVIDAVARQETLRAVVDAVDALHPSSREVVLLRHFDGLPPREIAVRLGVPVETVKKRLSRAHRALRASLAVEEPQARARRLSALASFAGIELELSSLVTATGGAVMAWTGKSAAVGATVLLALGCGAWHLLGRGESRGGSGGAAQAPVVRTADAPAAPELAGTRTVSRPAAPASAPARSLGDVRHSWIHGQRGRVRLLLPRDWTDPNPGRWDLPEAGRWVGPLKGGGSALWAVLARSEADAWLARLTDVSEAGLTIGDRGARMFRGSETANGLDLCVRVIRLAPLDGFEEPFAFVASVPANAPAEVDETIDLILSHVRLTPLPAAISAAVGEVPGDMVEIAVFLDGEPAVGGVTIERWSGETTFQEDGTWGGRTRTPSGEIPLALDGRARFDRLEAGDYEVTIRGPMIGAHRISTTITGRAPVPHPRLVLALGAGVLRGRAFSRDGRLATGATVRFNAADRAYGPLIVLGEAQVDADGRYELRGLPLWSGILSLELPALEGMPQASRREHVDLRSANPLEQDLGDGRPLPVWRGSVLDGSGHSVAGPGTLNLVRLQPEPGRWWLEQAVIRRDGKFEARVAPGAYRVTGQVVRPDAPPRTLDGLEIEIPPLGLERDVVVGGGTLVILVRGADGAPAAGVDIDIEPVAATRSWSRGQRTDETGVARFQGLPAGRYRITTTEGTATLRGGGQPEVEVRGPSPTTSVELELLATEPSPPPSGR